MTRVNVRLPWIYFISKVRIWSTLLGFCHLSVLQKYLTTNFEKIQSRFLTHKHVESKEWKLLTTPLLWGVDTYQTWQWSIHFAVFGKKGRKNISGQILKYRPRHFISFHLMRLIGWFIDLIWFNLIDLIDWLIDWLIDLSIWCALVRWLIDLSWVDWLIWFALIWLVWFD